MTDHELAVAVGTVKQMETTARAHHAHAVEQGERDAALGAMRQAGALRRALENWIVERALRTQQAATAR